MTIEAKVLEESEKALRLYATTGIVPDVLFERVGVDREGFERFLTFQLEKVRSQYPDLDPRGEPMLRTVMLHLFLTGVVAARRSFG